jgi:LuxR family maltose regulon positive regulatory protein
LVTVAAAGPRLSAPIHRPGLVRRSRLLERLSLTSAQPLVVLVAPAGYGKTTALAQWVEADHRDAMWVTVETSDNDPARMLDQIGIALRHLEGDSALVARPRPSRGLTVADLVEQVRKRGRPVLLALDDLHHLQRTPVPNLLVELATRLPAGSQVAMASRTHSPLRLGRLRAERLCVEFGPADLAFDASEAAEVFARAATNVSPEDVLRLLDRTEGWPAGIYLAAVALRDRVDLTAAPDRFSGDDAYIADFFRDELMAGESPETVRFLLRTSVLGSLSAELSDAVLGTSDSADRLAEIEQRNLFLVPLDHRREWYRYHRLFAETLTAELRRREPGEEQRVHRRAADWYEQQGMVEQAVAHWSAGSEPTKVAGLGARYGRPFVASGRIATVRGWFEAIGPEAVESDPPAALTAAWTYALSGDPARAHRFLLAAGRAEFTGPMPDGHASLRSGVTLLRATMGSRGIERMRVDALEAVELEPPGSPFHPAAALTLGVADLLSGSADDASKHLEQAALLGREHGRASAQLALAELALLALDRHDDAKADDYARKAHEVMTAGDLQNDMLSVLTHLVTAQAHLRAQRRDAARHELGTSVRLYLAAPATAIPWLATQTALVLGEVSLQLEDVTAAHTRLEDARLQLARLPTEGILRNRLNALSEALTQARVRGARPSAMALTPAEERVLRLLPTHLSLSEIGDELHVTRHTVKSQVVSIYRKLQASTRTEAVNRARELGLLSN